MADKLRNSESLFRNFFNLPLVGAAITSREKGWVEVNDQTCKILGYTREELFAKDWAELTHPDDLAADIAQFERMLAGEINSYSMEKRFIRSDGTIVWTILSGGRSRLSGPGSEYFYVQILDISDRKHSELLLEQAKLAAENANMALEVANKELQRLARTDPLTGIWNRRHFEEALTAEIERARRYAVPVSLVVFDVDHFKSINDQYGHSAGDDILVQLACLVGAHLRVVDLLARWGGEEFVVLIPNNTLASAEIVAEKLRVLIEEALFKPVGRVTASFGVTQINPGDQPEVVFSRADKAMYQAKAAGRNRVMSS